MKPTKKPIPKQNKDQLPKVIKDPFKKSSLVSKTERRVIGTFFSLFYGFIIILFSFYLIIIVFNYQKSIKRIQYLVLAGPQQTTELPKLDSCNALQEKLKKITINQRNGMYEDMAIAPPMATGLAGIASKAGIALSEMAKSPDYSQTNIQVAGVDEADIVKTDGKYIYTLSNNNLTISLAYPAPEAELFSRINISGNPIELFIDGNDILVFGSRRINNIQEIEQRKRSQNSITPEINPPYPISRDVTFVEIYNLADPAMPVLKRKLEFDGNYVSSRKIGSYVYFLLNIFPDYGFMENDMSTISFTRLTPSFRDLRGSELTVSDKEFGDLVPCSQVYYIDPVASNEYLAVIGLPINDYKKEVTKKVILGASQNIYASTENLYIANTEYENEYTAGGESLMPQQSSNEVTRIFKFLLLRDKIEFITDGQVPGRILNQFSMDEYNNYFRIATTLGHVSRGGDDSSNNIYVLDSNLQIVGRVEDIAPGEKIYSARFMGDKGYLVTFKKVDPFFTIDLTIPTAPKILGKLKIPGYSDYLHPYDENHIIGIGKDTQEAAEGGFAWYQGIKMALFDVSDFNNPKEISKVVIGDRGTDSPILTDHKALLFSKEKNLLVIPVTLAEISDEQKADPNLAAFTYGDYVFQGSYVYAISPATGFVLKGTVTHVAPDNDVYRKSGYYFSAGDYTIKRNLFIDGSLYSVSNNKIMINDLNSLATQGEVNLNPNQAPTDDSGVKILE